MSVIPISSKVATTRHLWILVPLMAFMACCAGVKESPPAATELPANTQTADETTMTALVSAADLQFGDETSTMVISTAQKFILPIPELVDGGEPLVYPPNDNRAGEPIEDYKGEPIGARGLVFFNQEDRTVQAVAGDGNGVIIINEVTVDQASALHQYIVSLTSDPAALTLEQLQQIIAYTQEELNLGDMYNSDRTFVAESMSAIDTWDAAISDAPVDPAYGFKKRDDRDINQAIYIPGDFQFQGPAATPQRFEDGGVIVQHDDSVRGVQPDIFLRTYSFSDGQPILDVSDLATQSPF